MLVQRSIPSEAYSVQNYEHSAHKKCLVKSFFISVFSLSLILFLHALLLQLKSVDMLSYHI